jgi:hypothetical protein
LGGRFPALGVFALPALSVLLALVVLWGLKPWEDDSDDPQLAPLGIEIAVDDGKALPLPAGLTASVAAGRVAPAGPKLVVQSAESVGRGAADAGPALAVAPAQAIALAEVPSSPQSPQVPAPESGAGAEAPSVGATDVEAPAEGTSAPATVPVSTGSGTSGGPVASGGGPAPESCEGDEYLVTVTFLEVEEPIGEESEESIGEESAVEIVLQRLNEDGSADDELRLEGDLNDARSLVLKLRLEGSCVEVVIAQPQEEAEEVPEAGEEVAGPAESPELISP